MIIKADSLINMDIYPNKRNSIKSTLNFRKLLHIKALTKASKSKF